MSKSYEDITKRLSKALAKVRRGIPEAMSGFGALAQAAKSDGALDPKTKELIALGIAIASRCEGCIGFHIKALIELGVSRDEILDTLGVAIYMGGGPSLMYAAEALDAFEEFSS